MVRAARFSSRRTCLPTWKSFALKSRCLMAAGCVIAVPRLDCASDTTKLDLSRPSCAASKIKATEAAMAAAQNSTERKPALLVVDDDPLITDTLAFALGPDFEVYA